MARISVLGGTGYSGANILREAVKRGHQVTSYSRSMPAEPVAGATYRTGSVLDEAFLAQSVTNSDVVFVALAARGELEDKLSGVVARLMALAFDAKVRLGVLGGASSLLVAPDGPRLIDLAPASAPVRPEMRSGIELLALLRADETELDWFYISPAGGFGSWAPGVATGRYRTSDDVLLVDENGKSNLSGADLATAIVDEIENPVHRRQRFHVAY